MRRLFGSILFFTTLSAGAQIGSGVGGVVGGVPGSQPGGPLQLVVEYKTIQTLADGTHITTERRESTYRDSQGRTRSENENLTGMGALLRLHTVSVRDPVAGVNYNWTDGPPNMPHEYTKIVQNQAPIIRNAPDASGDLAALSAPPPPTPPPPVLNRAQPAQPQQGDVPTRPLRPETHRESLGPDTVQGFSCQNERITTVYPQGYFGNDRPITVVREQCMSREIGRVLKAHVVDPRTGDQTTTVISISRAEPDASMFQPPADYAEREPNRR